MPFENPQNIIRSWNLQSNFATGPVVVDKLTPPPFGRIRTNFISTWREENLDCRLDWGKKDFSVYLPESLQVVGGIYLKIALPGNSAGTAYKDYPGLYALDKVRLVSGGQEVYSCDVQVMLGDYCQSLSEEQLKVFARTYLGHQASMDGNARNIMIPILLPNSAYGSRNGHDTRGHGVFPAKLGNQRLEIQLSLCEAKNLSSSTEQAPGSIANACSLMYHEIQMTGQNARKYQDLRGGYSIINRRFTEITSGWTDLGDGDTAVVRHSQPQGTVTEIQIIAVQTFSDDPTRVEFKNYVRPTSIKCTADAIVQRDLDTVQKVEAELWVNGFVPPDDFPAPGRLCFASHAAEAAHIYSGGYNMTLASNVDFEFTMPGGHAHKYRIFAVQLQRVKIDSAGRIRALLE